MPFHEAFKVDGLPSGSGYTEQAGALRTVLDDIDYEWGEDLEAETEEGDAIELDVSVIKITVKTLCINSKT